MAVCVGSRPRNAHEVDVEAWTVARWEATFPDWPVCVADSGDGPYNRSAARNVAAAQAGPVDVLVFANADTTFREPAEMAAAVAHASVGGWVLCESYVETSQAWTVAALGSDPGAPLDDPTAPGYDRLVSESPAGWQVLPRVWFEDVGGWDEGFGSGWGWEDKAFMNAVDVLCGSHVRVGWAVHLWHPRGRELSPRANGANRARWSRLYGRALGRSGADRVRAMRSATRGVRL